MNAVAAYVSAARVALAAELVALDPAARIDTARRACIDTGGWLIPAQSGRNGAHFAELHLLGIYHSGADEAEAIANWIKAVQRLETGVACDDPSPLGGKAACPSTRPVCDGTLA